MVVRGSPGSSKSASPDKGGQTAADLLVPVEEPTTKLQRSMFTNQDNWSDVSDEEQLSVADINPDDLDEEHLGQEPTELDTLLADTPLSRLKKVEKEANKYERKEECSPEILVQMRQHALGLSKVARMDMDVFHNDPLLVSRAHADLARAYQLYGCAKQATEHCKRSLEAIPDSVREGDDARALRQKVLLMRAEALLQQGHGKAAQALVLLHDAANTDEVTAVEDMGTLALIGQCHSYIAEGKMQAARNNREAVAGILGQMSELEAKMDRRTERGDAFYSEAQIERMSERWRELNEDKVSAEEDVARLAEQAEHELDTAFSCMNTIVEKIKSKYLDEHQAEEPEGGEDGWTQDPVYRALWARSIEILLLTADAQSLQPGRVKEQLRTLGEVESAYVSYPWLAPSRHAQALREKGALLVAERQYEDALRCYDALLDLVRVLFPDDPVRRAVQRAEVLKLQGDVYVALQDFRTAQHYFSEALKLFQTHLGVDAGVAQDLAHRIEEVKQYLSGLRAQSLQHQQPASPSRHESSVGRSGGAKGGSSNASAASAANNNNYLSPAQHAAQIQAQAQYDAANDVSMPSPNHAMPRLKTVSLRHATPPQEEDDL